MHTIAPALIQIRPTYYLVMVNCYHVNQVLINFFQQKHVYLSILSIGCYMNIILHYSLSFFHWLMLEFLQISL